jgi:hypothetical protein
MNIKKVITHKYFHYTAIALMIFNIIGYVAIQSMECVLVFGAASYAANHFTKNRALDIFIGLFVANVLFGCGRVKEGMEVPSKPSDKITKVAGDTQNAADSIKKEGKCGEGEKWDEENQKCAAVAENAADKMHVIAEQLKTMGL